MANYEKITELFKDDAFLKAANECKTMEDFHALFNCNGAEITEEETVDLISKIAEKRQQMDNGELSAEDLDNVAGGLALTGAAAVAACVGLGVVGIGVAAGAAFVAYQALRWGYKHKH